MVAVSWASMHDLSNKYKSFKFLLYKLNNNCKYNEQYAECCNVSTPQGQVLLYDALISIILKHHTERFHQSIHSKEKFHTPSPYSLPYTAAVPFCQQWQPPSCSFPIEPPAQHTQSPYTYILGFPYLNLIRMGTHPSPKTHFVTRFLFSSLSTAISTAISTYPRAAPLHW